MAVVRISDRTQDVLKVLATEAGEPMTEVVDRAVEAYRRRHILERTNAAYAAMRASPEAWREELEERAAWDGTLADGLEGD